MECQILSSGLKGNIEELPLGPAGPPLGGTIGGQGGIINLLSQPGPSLVSQLEQEEGHYRSSLALSTLCSPG